MTTQNFIAPAPLDFICSPKIPNGMSVQEWNRHRREQIKRGKVSIRMHRGPVQLVSGVHNTRMIDGI